MPLSDTVSRSYDTLDLLRGTETFLNCVPGASMVAMRRGLRSIGVDSRTIGHTAPRCTSAPVLLTGNTETTYGMTFLALDEDGPTVIEAPGNSLCIVDDMWQRYVTDMGIAGPDRGEGGKYGLGAAKNYAVRGRYEVDANRELIGLGAAGLGAGLSSGMVVNGSLSKTAVNWSAGARSQLSGVFVAPLIVITLLFLTGLFEKLPEAVLAGVVIAAVVELVDLASLAALHRVFTRRLGQDYGVAARPDFLAAVVAMLGVLVFDTLPGLFLGIGASLLLLLYRSSRPVVSELGQLPGDGHFAALDRHRHGHRIPGVVVLRVEGGMYFANAERIRATVRQAADREGTTAVVIDAETVPFIDVSAVRMLDQLAGELEARGVRLLLARDVGQVRDVLRAADAGAELRHIHPTVREAVDAARTGT
ncbi:SulP family inorganic anion transporter [Streptomyces griseoincarnatus]